MNLLIHGRYRHPHTNGKRFAISANNFKGHIADCPLCVYHSGIKIITKNNSLHPPPVTFRTAHSGGGIPLHGLSGCEHIVYCIKNGCFTTAIISQKKEMTAIFNMYGFIREIMEINHTDGTDEISCLLHLTVPLLLQHS